MVSFIAINVPKIFAALMGVSTLAIGLIGTSVNAAGKPHVNSNKGRLSKLHKNGKEFLDYKS